MYCGKIFAISISNKKGNKKFNVEEAELLADYGIKGDAHAGINHRQVSLLTNEAIREFKKNGLDLSPGDFAENITTQDIDLSLLKIGSKIYLGREVLLEVTQIGKKCHSNCSIMEQVGNCIMPHLGIFTRVLQGGLIHAGDKICIK